MDTFLIHVRGMDMLSGDLELPRIWHVNTPEIAHFGLQPFPLSGLST